MVAASDLPHSGSHNFVLSFQMDDEGTKRKEKSQKTDGEGQVRSTPVGLFELVEVLKSHKYQDQSFPIKGER